MKYKSIEWEPSGFRRCYKSSKGCYQCKVRDICGNFTWSYSDEYRNGEPKPKA